MRRLSSIQKSNAWAVRAWGMTRSLLMYHGQPWRWRRMRRFYSQFVGPGELAFDVGAHVGNRVACWLGLGARVLAVEPQPDFIRLLRALYGRREHFALESRALGAHPGRATMHLSSATPTCSTLSQAWIDDVGHDARFASIRYNQSVTVEVTTMDALIAEHGMPKFCKIDAEGYEGAILAGLSRPLPALSFEYIPITCHQAIACVQQLCTLGEYSFTWSPVETMRFASPGWVSADAIVQTLARMPKNAGSGDIYARLIA